MPTLSRCPALLFAAMFIASTSFAQSPASTGDSYSSSNSSNIAMLLPDAPSMRRTVYPDRNKPKPYDHSGYSGFIGLHVSCGGGLDLLQGKTQGDPVMMCGAGFTLIPYSAIEFGGIKLQDGSAHFYLSEDFIAPITPVFKRLRGEPIGILGYTKVVGNSNRLDYGVGWEHHIGPEQSLGFEVRDYVQFTDPVRHDVVFRVALVSGVSDATP